MLPRSDRAGTGAENFAARGRLGIRRTPAMVLRRFGLILLSCAAFCCQQQRELPAPPVSGEPSANAEQQQVASIADPIALVKTRLEQQRELPRLRKRERCPDHALSLDAAGAQTLIVRVRQEREEIRSPLPLKLLTTLESDEFATVLTHLSGGAAALWDAAHAGPSDMESAKRALDALDAIQKRPYLGQLVIESYADPKLFRRKDARTSEWAPGEVRGRFVVYEMQSNRPICQAPLVVRGDAQDAPVSRRMREVTREKVREALLDRVWSGMESALSSISSRLSLPHPSLRGDPDTRWAAPEPSARLVSQ